MLTQIYNGHILTPQGWIDGGSVLMENGLITEIRKNSNFEPHAEKTVDAQGMHVVPGGIELHSHGAGGRDFMEGTAEAFQVAVHSHLLHGTTAIFPTLSSSTAKMIEDACTACQSVMENDPETPVMGLHLEGPYFNPRKSGAQLPDIIRTPDEREYHHFVEDFDCIRRWDAAPELPGAIEFGKYVTSKGILAAIGHTDAEYPDVKAAWDAGYRHVTHFYNAMPGFHNVREYKHAGTVEAVYLIEPMTVEVIADGIHVPAPILKLIAHVKGVERMALITDSLAVTASNTDRAFDPRVIIEDGVCKLSDRSALAGSIATMDRLIRTAVNIAEIPLNDAIRMVSETPARIMGIYDRKGSLQRGKDADVLILDDALSLRSVYAMGKLVEGTDTLGDPSQATATQ